MEYQGRSFCAAGEETREGQVQRMRCCGTWAVQGEVSYLPHWLRPTSRCSTRRDPASPSCAEQTGKDGPPGAVQASLVTSQTARHLLRYLRHLCSRWALLCRRRCVSTAACCWAPGLDGFSARYRVQHGLWYIRAVSGSVQAMRQVV